VNLNFHRSLRLASLLGALGLSARAQTILPPPDAGYVLPDGSIQIVCSADLLLPTQRLGQLFAESHPSTRFTVHPANDLAALQTLAFDASAFAPVGTDALGGAAVAYGALVHADPYLVRIAHASLDPAATVSPLAVIAHPSNPIDHLSVDQVARIFTETMRKPTLTHWGQLGIGGPLAPAAIHPCGIAWSEHLPSEDTAFGDWMFQRKLGGGPPVATYEIMGSYAEVGQKVAADPSALGLIALNRVPAGVKVLGLNATPWAEPSRGSPEDIAAGRYPFDRYLYIYIRRVAGRPFDALVREYVRLALSPAGQRILANDARHYLPLNFGEIAEELAKLPAEAARPATAPPAGQTATASKTQSYVLSDGSIYIAGNDLMTPIIAELNARFQQTHPGFKFTMQLFGSGLGLSGITAGKSALGPMARDPNIQEIGAFTSRYGYPPLDIRIGWDNTPDADHFPPGKFPPAVWVNARNPVPSLTLREVAGIFTAGSAGGDITRWGQISGDEGAVGANGGDWAKRAIHVYLPILRGLPIVSTTRYRLGGLPWSTRVEYLPMGEDVINAVANDPFGIGLIGWFPTDEGWDRQTELGAKVRLLPLAEDRDAKVSHGGVGDLYPLAGGLHLLVNRPPGQPIEPWLKAYLTMALSPEGQALIASLTKTDGFIPLEPDDLAVQLKKLQ